MSLGFLGADGLPLPLDLAYANTHRDARHRFEQCAELGLATRCGRKVASIAETHRLLGIPVPS